MEMNKELQEYIIKYIKPHKDFTDTINQHNLTKRINDDREIWGQKPVNTRRVRKYIERLIELGFPIISTPHDPGGYCWGGKDGEAIQCYKRLRRKAAKEFAKARHVLRNIYNGQLDLFSCREKVKNS